MHIYIYLILMSLLTAQNSLVQNDYSLDPDRLHRYTTNRVVVEGKIPVRFFEISNSEDLSTGVNITNSVYGGNTWSERYFAVCSSDPAINNSSYFSICKSKYAVEKINFHLSKLSGAPDTTFIYDSYQRIYDPVNFNSGDGHGMLANYYSDPEINAPGYLNIIVTNSMNGLAGTTYLYQDITDESGALLVVEAEPIPAVIIHELGHVVGFPHLLEPSAQITFEGDTINIPAIGAPNCDPNFMSAWVGSNCEFENPNFTKEVDLNGDGSKDLISANSARTGYDGKYGWHENNGDNTFSHHVIFEDIYANNINNGDLDLDGDIDVVTASSELWINDSGTFSWHENDGAENFTRHEISSGNPGASSIIIVDIDSDGDNDIIGGSKESSIFSLFINDGNQNFDIQTLNISAGDGFQIQSIDLDGDQDLDILVVGSEYVKHLTWFENNGNLSFTEHLIVAEGIVSAKTIDYDNDGDLDIITFDDRVRIYYNDGAGNFNQTLYVGWGWDVGYYNPKALHIDDLDGDGSNEIVAAYMNGICYWKWNGETFTVDSIYSGADIKNFIIKDMNDDGQKDILISEHNPYKDIHEFDLFWIENNSLNDWQSLHGITGMLRLNLSTEQHGSSFSNIFTSWVRHNSNMVLDIKNDLTPEKIIVYQNYPNPFNPATQIRYDLKNNEYVTISIYNVMGHKVKSLLEARQGSGYKSIIWDATNDLGQSVSAGMYIYTVQAKKFRQTKKMLLLK